MDQHPHTRAQRLHQIRLPPQPQLLLLRPLRPRARRHLKDLLAHLLETQLLHPAPVVRRVGPGPPDLRGGLDARAAPDVERRPCEGAVVAVHREDGVLHLEVAAGEERVVGFGEDRARGGEAGHHAAHVDEIEGVAVHPDVFCVVDFELAVWGDAGVGVR